MIELEPEVQEWPDPLPISHYRVVERHADRLADHPATLGEPYPRHLHGPVRELRFVLGSEAVRISHWSAPDRRTVSLTVFRENRMREEAQVQRALQVQKECEAGHPSAGKTYHRAWEEQP